MLRWASSFPGHPASTGKARMQPGLCDLNLLLRPPPCAGVLSCPSLPAVTAGPLQAGASAGKRKSLKVSWTMTGRPLFVIPHHVQVGALTSVV